MQSYSLSDAMSVSTHLLADRLLIQDWAEDLPWHDVMPDWLANERHLLPAVLRLKELDDTQRERVEQYLISDSAEVGAAMLICSELSAEAQARQLARHVVITLDDDSRALLRFADPAVFVHLLWVLPLPHLASLCDGASRWWLPFQGLWYELEFSGRPEARWSKLDEFQSIALTNVGLVNDALATMPEPLDIKRMWRRSQEINQWLGVAQSEFGLVNAHDCVAFARHGYLLGRGFSNHPKLVPHLRDAVATPGLYAQATALFSEKEWNNLIADIERINQKQEAP
ncbi:DUF4123 domain-containing protein [Burkholderia cenocepacia]|uniref:DUF4123 domain-containing protein n=1 Tax=Burkholderia TaxID=32008 RepID=UPI000F590A51|nr:DUF4123 domain-containing protein [Burkholderia sp. AcTa6-5]RQU77759.1 DUF4123 domain-containing protein [Burkholderia cenocepacia]MBP0711861.1 DUF4123 domain-containing protein [Burkholderia sp. AcTa6-5]RQV09118.1 DUF4123 domain-containing protein [Burkholderia cenocepacia]RQV30023.1 DUF4123 domain-containing protein [Burkholderia cenocepacia]RQV75103.1 DUF4123 domain-containing protein [Burkholderia cenocepacia]